MSQNAVTQDVFRRRVPTRTWFYYLLSNNFQYIIAYPTILALILFLDTDPIASIGLGLLVILGISALWTTYYLDVSVKSQKHPHHRMWNSYRSFLSLFAPFVQQRPAWQKSLVGLLLASIPILVVTWAFIARPSIREAQAQSGFDLYWLAYIPVLIWASFRVHDLASEWFAVLWLLGTIIYSACFFFIYREFSPENINHLLTLMGWFLFHSTIVYYLFRQMSIFRGQAEILRTVTRRLRDDRRYTEAFDVRPVQSSPDPSLNEIAEQIGISLFYDRVFILVRDDEKEELFLKGRYGTQAPWPKMGWSIAGQQSITGWVAQNKSEHLCPDTSKCDLFFNPEKAYPCKSEAAVPILVEDRCVGVIDLQSDHPNAFHRSDIRMIWQIANAISGALNYERFVSKEVDRAHRLLEQASEILIESKNLDEALKKVAQKLRELFHADLVVLYKHAVATCVPLPGLITDGHAICREILGHTIRRESRVIDLIRRTDELYVQPRADEDQFLLGPNHGDYDPEDAQLYGNPHRFVKREKIKSMIYIKLGLGNEIVGSLFLNYRRQMDFPPRMIESLRAFANVLTMGLILKRQTERAVGPLAGTIPLAHSTAEAAFESVSRDFDEIDWKQIKHSPENHVLLKQVKAYRRKLEQLRREWTNLILVEQVNLHRSSMAEPITHLESKLHSMFPGVGFKWDSREFLDLPTDELGEVIYKVIAEGVSNALVHARAGRIQLQCKKENYSITILVTNDGEPIEALQAERINNLIHEPLEIDPQEKQTGIISILLDSRRWFGAKWNFSSTATNATELTVVFPLNHTEEQEEDSDEDETDLR